MNFDSILEYQKLDQEYSNLNGKINGSEEAKIYTTLKARVADDEQKLKRLLEQANSLVASFTSFQEKVDALKEQLEDYETSAQDLQDLGETDYLLKHLNETIGKISALEKEIAAHSKKMDEVNEQYVQLNARIKKERMDAEKARQAGQEFAAPIREQMAVVKQKRDALVPSIDKKVLELYNAAHKSQKLPVIVEYKGTPGCPRCGMILENSTKAKLAKPGDYAECPNCRRVLFIPEK